MFAALVLAFAQSTAPEQATHDTWDSLAKEYEHAFETWISESMRSGNFARPEAERTPGPAPTFAPRFETLAAGGEGRAVLWLLDNAKGTPDLLASRQKCCARVEAAGDADWVAAAITLMAEDTAGLDAVVLERMFRARSLPEHALPVRLAALLGRARLASDPAQAAELRLAAAFLRFRDADIAPGEALADEDIRELAPEALEAIEKEHQQWFETANYAGPDDVYLPHCASPPDPQQSWRPVIETLAVRGAVEARCWVLFNTWPHDDAERERMRAHLEALTHETIPLEQLKQLTWYIDSFVKSLGSEFVEPRVRQLLEKVPEEARRGLLYGLGDGLCAAAADDAQRERGLALLREVCTRWPGSDEAQRATGKLFRHENLLVGKKIPDFEAVDVDGNAFKLSDYEGKVTVIDFWGFW